MTKASMTTLPTCYYRRRFVLHLLWHGPTENVRIWECQIAEIKVLVSGTYLHCTLTG